MIQELAQEILKGTSVGAVEDSVTVHSAPPILQTRLRAAEVSASVLSAQAMLINHDPKLCSFENNVQLFVLLRKRFVINAHRLSQPLTERFAQTPLSLRIVETECELIQQNSLGRTSLCLSTLRNVTYYCKF